jgi:hypothetical protein
MNHRLAMLIHLHPHLHPDHARTHTRRHLWFSGQTFHALSPPQSALIHHRVAMFLPPDPHLPCRIPRPHIP